MTGLVGGLPTQQKQNKSWMLTFRRDFKVISTWLACSSWPEIDQLSPEFLEKASHFKQMVRFTNVIFDTSQPHANVIFEDMFVWLDEVALPAKSGYICHPSHQTKPRVGKASEKSVASGHRQDVEVCPMAVHPTQDLSTLTI